MEQALVPINADLFDGSHYGLFLTAPFVTGLIIKALVKNGSGPFHYLVISAAREKPWSAAEMACCEAVRERNLNAPWPVHRH